MNRLFQSFGLRGLSLILFSSLILIVGWSLQNRSSLPPAIAQDIPPQTLTVTGEGTQSIPTTLTEVQLGVEVEGATATEVQAEAAQRSTAVVEFLRSRDVEKLETTGIRLQPQYRYNDGERSLTGYQALNLVSFRIATEEIGNLLDETVKAGATRIDAVNFTATESAIAQAQKDALQAATLDAKAQADAVLGALNLHSQSVINIQINNASPPVMPQAETFRA
ncbi:MAG: SIMPL domain-containing protein, partial [Halothece sp. Uz-M2-17]|nr:SIMPL domain-containing protein [Halothece sp. Uz-M2-17]